ncbi:AbiJ-NTD4 domain-containing protein [Agromyces sp. GXS1127]|uniref:AbiJ-NTD4 domain-containing protein n=1 Tax=Agromyces sp. GXS1127 TaxID=3424181 RepID=UPI003D3222D2
MKFSEKYGYTQARTVAQVESMDAPLRTALWNVTYERFFSSYDRYLHAYGLWLVKFLWASHFHRDLRTVPVEEVRAAAMLRKNFEEDEWYEVYDLIQVIVGAKPESTLIEAYNRVLEIHLAGYRIVGTEVTPLTSPAEVAAVEDAITDTSRFAGANHHLKSALTLYSRLESPDYANSIKESISAVEAMVKELTGKSPLGDGLSELRRQRPDLDGALVSGWKSLYGYTSNAGGVRHGGLTGPNVTQADARYFLVTCSAFVNLLMTLA